MPGKLEGGAARGDRPWTGNGPRDTAAQFGRTPRSARARGTPRQKIGAARRARARGRRNGRKWSSLWALSAIVCGPGTDFAVLLGTLDAPTAHPDMCMCPKETRKNRNSSLLVPGGYFFNSHGSIKSTAQPSVLFQPKVLIASGVSRNYRSMNLFCHTKLPHENAQRKRTDCPRPGATVPFKFHSTGYLNCGIS